MSAADGYDAVIRHGPFATGTRLIARRLASSRRGAGRLSRLLARHGTPASADELAECNATPYSNRETDWRFTVPGRKDDVVIRPRRCTRINNGIMLRDAAIAGIGVVLLPTFLCYTGVASDALRIIDIGMDAESAEIQIAYLSDRGPSAKIRALTEHLQKAFGDPPYWKRKCRCHPSPASERGPEPAPQVRRVYWAPPPPRSPCRAPQGRS